MYYAQPCGALVGCTLRSDGLTSFLGLWYSQVTIFCRYLGFPPPYTRWMEHILNFQGFWCNHQCIKADLTSPPTFAYRIYSFRCALRMGSSWKKSGKLPPSNSQPKQYWTDISWKTKSNRGRGEPVDDLLGTLSLMKNWQTMHIQATSNMRSHSLLLYAHRVYYVMAQSVCQKTLCFRTIMQKVWQLSTSYLVSSFLGISCPALRRYISILEDIISMLARFHINFQS